MEFIELICMGNEEEEINKNGRDGKNMDDGRTLTQKHIKREMVHSE